jgi:hypothetical protein
MTTERHEFARTLRKHPTRAEESLWQRLRGSRFHGAKFRRQVPFDGYVVDFYCHAAKLVVEIDGKQHGSRITTSGGLRFWNGSACGSSASPMPRCATTSTLRWRGCTRRCDCRLNDALIPSPPTPLPPGEGWRMTLRHIPACKRGVRGRLAFTAFQ